MRAQERLNLVYEKHHLQYPNYYHGSRDMSNYTKSYMEEIQPISTTPGQQPGYNALQRNTPATAIWLAPAVSMFFAHSHIP